MKNRLKIFNFRSSSAGFTLIELLVAASITTIVVSLAGSGLVSIMQNNSKAEAETSRRVELNRALDFINEEVRMSKSIATDASANLTTVAKDFKSSGIPVLTLEIPGVSQRVIYYLKDASSPWAGPKVLYRWGPGFKNDGNYVKDDNDPNTHEPHPQNPADWKDSLLVDLITDTKPYLSTTCPTALTGWTANPSVTNGQGFTACVDPTSKIAEINLRGKLTDAYGNSRNPFEVSTRAFARPSEPPLFVTSSGATPGSGSGTITINQPARTYVEVLGGSIYCGATRITTKTTVNVTPNGGTTTSTTLPSSNQSLDLPSLAAGTTVTVTGTAEPTSELPPRAKCFNGSRYNSTTNAGTQVLTLRNGDKPPLFDPYGGQPSIDSFLTNYLDPATGTVTLKDNQVIFLFELGATSGAAYDMQDLVVLATISPP